MILRILSLVIGLSLFACRSAASAGDVRSGSWDDGWAELDGYRWSGTRYGERRTGEAVMIFVAEPFSRSKFVKVNDPTRNPADTFQAYKLNLIRDFQTGVYDYNTMVSVFTRLDDLSPVKTSFTSAEWCGHVYEELLFDAERVRERFFSYFEDETSEQTLDRNPDGLVEDNLFIRLRGLRGDLLQPGEVRTVPFLPSAFVRRLTHRPIAWTDAEIERARATENVEVPAGRFLTSLYVVRVGDGREGRFFIERDYPHRVVKWAWSGGRGEGNDSGELTGSSRLEYWRLHRDGDERYREELGLRPAR